MPPVPPEFFASKHPLSARGDALFGFVLLMLLAVASCIVAGQTLAAVLAGVACLAFAIAMRINVLHMRTTMELQEARKQLAERDAS